MTNNLIMIFNIYRNMIASGEHSTAVHNALLLELPALGERLPFNINNPFTEARLDVIVSLIGGSGYDCSGAGWSRYDIDAPKLRKSFDVFNHTAIADWFQKIAKYSDDINHHADFTITGFKVVVSLTTHDEDNTISMKDIHLAKIIDGFYADMLADLPL